MPTGEGLEQESNIRIRYIHLYGSAQLLELLAGHSPVLARFFVLIAQWTVNKLPVRIMALCYYSPLVLILVCHFPVLHAYTINYSL